MQLESPRLLIELQTRDELEAMIDAMPAYDRAQISPNWLARMRASTTPDPWVMGFRLVRRNDGVVVGSCSFKGPPEDGVVEIAYGIAAEHEGQGYATEAAQALVDFASGRPDIRAIRAHTLPDGVASKRVLEKCGFRYVGEFMDPEDGKVSRFERSIDRRKRRQVGRETRR